MELTRKQAEYWREGYHRYKIKCGATRSGKTYLDFFIIPRRIRELQGKDGLMFIVGNTKLTIMRNVIEPMKRIWGDKHIGDIHADNTSVLFGQKFHCLGADNKTHVKRFRGAKAKYIYGDEVVTWSEDVWDMLKTRLDEPYSMFEGTCNPEHPEHFLKKFIDTAEENGVDLYYQHYSIKDNEFLDENVRLNLEREHQGVLYERYILGNWTRAEGLIYFNFANKPELFTVKKDEHKKDILPRFMVINVGVDFGDTGSNTAFTAVGITPNYRQLYALKSTVYDSTNFTPDKIEELAAKFIAEVIKKYGFVTRIYYDYAENVLGRGIDKTVKKFFPGISVRSCDKFTIKERIETTLRLMGLGMFYITDDCPELKKALQNAVWSDKNPDERLKNKDNPMDAVDSFEYAAYSERIRNFIQ